MLDGLLIILGYSLTTAKCDELLAAARRRSDPHSLATALFNDCMHHLLLRDTTMFAERAEELLSISNEHGIALYMFAAIFSGAGPWPVQDESPRGSLRCAGAYPILGSP